MMFGLVLLATMLPVIGAQNCPYWKEIVESTGFAEYVKNATQRSQLDIVLPTDFGVEEAHLLRLFLKANIICARIFKDKAGFCTGAKCLFKYNEHELLPVLLVVCKNGITVKTLLTVQDRYYLFLQAACSKPPEQASNRPRTRQYKPRNTVNMKGNGAYTFTVREQSIVVIENENIQCLNCTDNGRDEIPFRIGEQLPLGGISFKIWCLHPHFCESPRFATFRNVILHKNASFASAPILDDADYLEGKRECMKNPATLFYFNWIISEDSQRSLFTRAHIFQIPRFDTYVKGLVPFPKEAVLLLPLQPAVWLALSAATTACILVSILVSKAVSSSVHDATAIILTFSASLMQQSCEPPPKVKKHGSFRMLFGVWMLSVTVIATGFKGALISLLSDVPMQGVLPAFTHTKTSYSMGFRACTLTYPLEDSVSINPGKVTHRWGRSCFDKTGEIRIGNDGKDVFQIFGSGFSKSDSLKDQLIRRGYTQTTAQYSPVISGPQIRTTSPYRKAIGLCLVRAFEGGLFEYTSRLVEYRNRVRREFTSNVMEERNDLNLNNLRPAFFVWAVGCAISGIFLILNVLRHLCKCWKM